MINNVKTANRQLGTINPLKSDLLAALRHAHPFEIVVADYQHQPQLFSAQQNAN